MLAGEEGICASTGVATLSISYYDLVRQPERWLQRSFPAKPMYLRCPSVCASVYKEVQQNICDALGVAVPDDYEAITRGITDHEYYELI